LNTFNSDRVCAGPVPAVKLILEHVQITGLGLGT
jgi:hypothetical protein